MRPRPSDYVEGQDGETDEELGTPFNDLPIGADGDHVPESEPEPETDFAAMSFTALDTQLGTLAGRLNATHYRLLTLIAELERRDPWAKLGHLSCAHYLNWRCGIALGAAREKVRTARSLAHLPLISQQFRRGRLSYSKVRALTRIASPENESNLLKMALGGTASHVERHVRRHRQALAAADPVSLYHRRRCHDYWDDEGMLVVHARLTAEQGAVFRKALDITAKGIGAFPGDSVGSRDPARAGDSAGYGDRARYGDLAGYGDRARYGDRAGFGDSADPVDHRAALRCDALARMCEGSLERQGGSGHAADRYMVHIDVPAETLAANSDDEVAPDKLATLENDGPPLSLRMLQRLCCDASIVVHTESESASESNSESGSEAESNAAAHAHPPPRRTRTIPTWLRRNVQRRDGGCRFPGCTNVRFVDVHHVVHWARGGGTTPDNLVTLCRRHHTLVHELDYRIEVEDGNRFHFFEPRGGAEVLATGDARCRGD